MNNAEIQLTFPCEFPIKVFGNASDDLEMNVLAIIRDFVGELDQDAVRSRHSKDRKYIALTIRMNITSREQLDSIYRELTRSPSVLMVL